MARYRKIDIRIRADAKFRRLSAPPPCGQSLWFHLLTGPHTGMIPGLAGIGEAAMAEELGWPLEGFRKAFAEVSREGMAKACWKARLVWVPNAIRYDPPQSPNVVISWRDAWDEIPECALKTEAWTGLYAFLEAKGKAFLEAFLKACPKPMANQEQEQEQEQDLKAYVVVADDPPIDPARVFAAAEERELAQRLAANRDPVALALAAAPLDDEPTTAEDLRAIAESLEAEGMDATGPLAQLALIEAKGFKPGDLVELWNGRAHKALPRVRELTADRANKARTRLREHGERDWWEQVIDAVNASPLCRGEAKPKAGASKPWRCSLDFLLDNPSNALKVLEGAYGDDRQADVFTENRGANAAYDGGWR